MVADLDWQTAASDPRVVVVVHARDYLRWMTPKGLTVRDERVVRMARSDFGKCSVEKVSALLDAVAEWDAVQQEEPGLSPDDAWHQEYLRDALTAAVTAIVGEQR